MSLTSCSTLMEWDWEQKQGTGSRERPGEAESKDSREGARNRDSRGTSQKMQYTCALNAMSDIPAFLSERWE